MNLPGPAKLVPGRDVALFSAEASTGGGGAFEFGEYWLIRRGDDWVFQHPHMEEALRRDTAWARRRGHQVVLRQVLPPCPGNDPGFVIELDANEEIL